MTSCTRAKTAMAYAVSIIAFSSVALPPCLPAAQRSGNADRPALQVPAIDSKPVIDGKLDEPFWKQAAKTGSLTVTRGKPAKSTTEAFISRDADHLYIGVTCAVDGQGPVSGRNAVH